MALPQAGSILIVDDDFGSRRGMRLSLAEVYPARRIAEASSLSEALEQLAANPDVELILLDLNLRDSQRIESLQRLKAWCEENDCSASVVVVSAAADYDDAIVSAVMEACAVGFVPKGAVSEERFLEAVALALSGGIFIPDGYLKRQKTELRATVLSPREREVAALLVKGLTYKQIARRLASGDKVISHHTVRVHVQRIAWKLRAIDEGDEAMTARAVVLTAIAEGVVQCHTVARRD